jgi:hypothetical protein
MDIPLKKISEIDIAHSHFQSIPVTYLPTCPQLAETPPVSPTVPHSVLSSLTPPLTPHSARPCSSRPFSSNPVAEVPEEALEHGMLACEPAPGAVGGRRGDAGLVSPRTAAVAIPRRRALAVWPCREPPRSIQIRHAPGLDGRQRLKGAISNTMARMSER